MDEPQDPLSTASSLTLTAVPRLGVGGVGAERERPQAQSTLSGLGAANWGCPKLGLPIPCLYYLCTGHKWGPRGRVEAQGQDPKPLRQARSRTRDRKHLDRQIQHKKAAGGGDSQERGPVERGGGVWLQVGATGWAGLAQGAPGQSPTEQNHTTRFPPMQSYLEAP